MRHVIGPGLQVALHTKMENTKIMNDTKIKQAVADTYGQAARTVSDGSSTSPTTGIASSIYSDEQAERLPQDAIEASLGCGNPTLLANLEPGETVLDLGSGGGIDVLLSASRVGPTGKAYGLDMSDDMLALAERNRAEAGATNVEFLRGEIESIPLPSNSVDVVISNCVINLSADKGRVLSEVFRVLRPGGRLAIADIATRGELPTAISSSLAAWAGCIAGALEVSEIESLLGSTGFIDPEVQVLRSYGRQDLEMLAESALADLDLSQISEATLDEIEGRLVSVFIRGTKPS